MSVIDDILRREGSEYTNDPTDRGGPTKYGITLHTLSAWRGVFCTEEDVKNLTESEARAIYQSRYVDAPHFNQISHDKLREFLIDWGVNSGPMRPISDLQYVLKVGVDGILGPETLAALEQIDQDELFLKMVGRRIKFLVTIALNDSKVIDFRRQTKTQLEFLAGWINRAVEFLGVR